MKQGTAIRGIYRYVDQTELELATGQTIILDNHDVELLEETFGCGEEH